MKREKLKYYVLIAIRYVLIFIFIFFFLSYSSEVQSASSFLASNSTSLKPVFPYLCGWYAEDRDENEEEILGNFTHFKEQGVGCVNYMCDLAKYERASKIAKQVGLMFNAWLPAMLGTGTNKQYLYDNHPEAYVVTRSGIHSHEQAIYGVSHYKFLCPNRPVTRDYLKEMYRNVSLLEDVDGINLDYIRYIELNWNQYNPNGDTCYCEYCVESYKNQTGRNISENEHPDLEQEWNDFRVNAITSLVNEIAEIVHTNRKLISADVYPGPWQSTKQTRQKWDDWDLDMVFPMIYTDVFKREVNWIGPQTGEGVAKLRENNKGTLLYTGLQAEAMNDSDFKIGVDLALKNGAHGVSLFKLNTINQEKYDIVNEELKLFLGN